jgi:ankyrin repeat protein
LQQAACQDNEHIVGLILYAGADVNSGGSRYHGSALHAATSCGNWWLVQVLLQAGADVNGMDEGFGSALQVASKNGDRNVVQLLLDAGADVNSTGWEFGSALQEAAKRNYAHRYFRTFTSTWGERRGNLVQVEVSPAPLGEYSHLIQLMSSPRVWMCSHEAIATWYG